MSRVRNLPDMSYDYSLFRVNRPVHSPKDLDESSVEALGSATEVRALLDDLIHGIEWNRIGIVVLQGVRLEFMVLSEQTSFQSISVHTSHRVEPADADAVIEDICRRGTFVAFDGQRNILLRG